MAHLGAAAEAHDLRVLHGAAAPTGCRTAASCRGSSTWLAVLDALLEDAEVVADAVADRGQRQRRQRVHEAGRQPAQAAVAQARVALLIEHVVEIAASRSAASASAVSVQAQVQQAQAQAAPGQELRRQIVGALDVALVVGALRGEPAVHQPIAHGVGQRLVQIARRGLAQIAAQVYSRWSSTARLNVAGSMPTRVVAAGARLTARTSVLVADCRSCLRFVCAWRLRPGLRSGLDCGSRALRWAAVPLAREPALGLAVPDVLGADRGDLVDHVGQQARGCWPAMESPPGVQPVSHRLRRGRWAPCARPALARPRARSSVQDPPRRPQAVAQASAGTAGRTAGTRPPPAPTTRPWHFFTNAS